jgi:hypothetical protein
LIETAGSTGGTWKGLIAGGYLEIRQGLPVNSSQVLQFHKINAPLAGFTFRDEGLRLRQVLSYVALGQTCFSPSLFQALEKRPVLPEIFPTLQKNHLAPESYAEFLQFHERVSQNGILLF